MAEFPALPLFTDAYLGDTQHLTLEEHGAYLKLLIIAWRTPDCSLPDDDKRLATMLGISVNKWKRGLRPALEIFFEIKGGKWIQKRLLKERKYVERNRKQKIDAGKASALKRNKSGSTAVPTDDATENPTESQREANGKGNNPYPYPSIESYNQPPSINSPGDGDPAKVVVDAFLNWRNHYWPNAPSFPAPTNTLETQARGFLADGADGQTIIAAVTKRMKAMAQAGEPPPTNLNFVRLSVQSAAAKANAKAETGTGIPAPIDENAQRRARLKALINDGTWLEGQWGDEPTVDEAKAELAALEADDRKRATG